MTDPKWIAVMKEARRQVLDTPLRIVTPDEAREAELDAVLCAMREIVERLRPVRGQGSSEIRAATESYNIALNDVATALRLPKLEAPQ